MITKILSAALAVTLLLLGLSLYAQVNRPYHSGSVWLMQFIRVKPGMDNAYKSWLATDWKKQQEAFKSQGLICEGQYTEQRARSRSSIA